jgi:ABC-2 type transport system ATP-binding protein
MKVGEQALYLAQLKGLSKSDAMKKLKYWFEKFEIQAWWGRKVEELSKGMQQKVQFIVTILHNPKLLIFDEPFSGFDPINVNLLRDEILNLRANGATIIFSTHNMASVEELCDHIALINKSRKILEGSVKEVRKQFRSDTYELTFLHANGQLQQAFSNDVLLVEESKEDEITHIKVKTTISRNELLQKMIPLGEIQSFKEVIPSMNDIFISLVQKDSKEQSN